MILSLQGHTRPRLRPCQTTQGNHVALTFTKQLHYKLHPFDLVVLSNFCTIVDLHVLPISLNTRFMPSAFRLLKLVLFPSLQRSLLIIIPENYRIPNSNWLFQSLNKCFYTVTSKDDKASMIMWCHYLVHSGDNSGFI